MQSPRSPLLNKAMMSPVEYLPTTRFPPVPSALDTLQESKVEVEKERDTILSQPYRTTQLILPGAKTRPDLINNKIVVGKAYKPFVYRPLDEKTVLTKLPTLDKDQYLVNRQPISPANLYSKKNFNDAVYVQTGVNLSAPVRRQPDNPIEFNPQNSPTFAALLEEEAGSVRVLPAPNINAIPPPIKQHSTCPGQRLNSVGQPTHRIAQSDSFRRLMINVLGEC